LESVQESDDDTESPISDSQVHQQSSIWTVLKYKDGAGSQLRGFYGAGSRATKYRRASEQHERMKVASQCYSIAAMFNNQKVQAKSSPIIQSKARQEAKEEIETLLRLKTITQKKFGPEGITLATRRRYEMVRSFYWTTEISPGISRKQAALNGANAFNRGSFTARQILKWGKQWMVDRLISPAKYHTSESHALSFLNDEGTMLAAREYISHAGDRIETNWILNYGLS